MASFRDSAPESFTRTIYRGSDIVTESTYRPETASDHLADSVYRPRTSSDQVDTSDSVAETKVPTRLKGPLKSRIISQLCEAEDFSADILHIPNQPARLVLQLGTQDATDQRHRDMSNNARQSRKIAVRNLPPAAENEEYLDIFFESKKRQGGGPVKKVTLMKDKHSAVIEFENPDAVKLVLDKVPITMHDHVVDVEVMVTLLDDDEDINSVQIKGLRGLADELRGVEVDGVINEEAQSPEKTVFKYSGIEAAKVWHFCAKELENIVTNFDALVTTEPKSGIPNSLTILAEKKFEMNIRRRLRGVKEKLLSLQEDSVADTDITADFADNISNFNAYNEHILLIGDVERREVLALFDGTFTHESAMDIVRKLNSQPILPVPPAAGTASVNTAHNLKGEKSFTVALEIGEIYSGYVFGFKHEYLKDPNKIYTQTWHAGSRNLIMSKLPTVVLFDERMELRSAGFEAENQYAELMLDCPPKKDMRWHYFERFTSFLAGPKVSSDTYIKDDNGREFLAKDVIVATMRYLKDHVIRHFQQIVVGLTHSDIHWVLTVPAHWSESAKKFMRYSANEAGMENEQLSLLLQSKAISLYAQVLHVNQTGKRTRTALNGPRKCMVISLGDEISRVTVLKCQPNGEQEEIFKMFSSTFCGFRVRDKFFQLLQELVGPKTWDEFRENYQVDFLDLKREFEVKFRSFESTRNAKVVFKIPISLRDCFFSRTGESMKEAISTSKFKGRIVWTGDKLRFEADIVNSFFNEYCMELVFTIRKLMENPQLNDTVVIILAGECAISPVIQYSVMKAFPDKEVVIPDRPDIAALHGAAIYGDTPIEVSYRIPKYTYGIIGPTPIHRMQQQQSDTAIQIYFPKGQIVRIGEIRSNPSYIETDRCTDWQWKVFATERKFLSTVDDGCLFLGTIMLTVQANDKPVRVDVDVMFGENELIVVARDLKTGKSVTLTADIVG